VQTVSRERWREEYNAYTDRELEKLECISHISESGGYKVFIQNRNVTGTNHCKT